MARVWAGEMTEGERHRTAGETPEAFFSTRVAGNRATQLALECGDPATVGPLSKREHDRVLQDAGATKTFHVAAERLPLLRVIYSGAVVEPELALPDSVRGKTWDRADAIRELVRGRIEVCGPVTVLELAEVLMLQRSEIDAALLALEAEGFVLRGKFHPEVSEQEWCDRRLLARIHRLTIDRLRAEIQPVSIQDFYRFLFACQRADHEPRVEGLEG